MASTYLTKTYSTQPTNSRIGTFSFWFKFSKLPDSEDRYLFSTYEDSNDRTLCKFNTSCQFELQARSGGNIDLRYDTNRVFRDTNAWYNIVIATDTTQSTAADRVKIYVNGVQETSFATSTAPSQNVVPHYLYGGIQKWIGVYGGGGANNWDGLMSHVAHIDGTQELPTIFGETDSSTGQWKIKTNIVPSSAWGTNGYWILKDGNTVTDSSSNSNAWTVGGGTLTKTEDNPSNVFATFNHLDNTLSQYAFSNGNLTGTYSGSNGSGVGTTATLGASSGKYYWEVKYNSSNDSPLRIGIIDKVAISTATTYRVGYAGNSSFAYNQGDGNIITNDTGTSYGNTFAVGDIIGVALDLDNNKIYFSKNGTFQNSGNPASNSNGFSITDVSSTASGFYFPVVSLISSGGVAQVSYNFGNGYFGTTAVSSAGTNASGNGIFEYDVPTGFTALSTKGLNT